jgi:hypothetical protein
MQRIGLPDDIPRITHAGMTRRWACLQIQNVTTSRHAAIVAFIGSFTGHGSGELTVTYARDRKSWINIDVQWTAKNKALLLALIKQRALRSALILVVQGKDGWADYEQIHNSFDPDNV